MRVRRGDSGVALARARPSTETEVLASAVWDAPNWDLAADLLLQRAALLARVQRNRPPDPLAGLKVDEVDLGALLAELPGLEAGDPSGGARLEAKFARSLEQSRAALARLGEEDDDLGQLARAARLEPLETAVLALLCAIEVDPRRQRLVGYLNDDVTQRRPTLWSLGALLGRSQALVTAVGPSGGLRRAALLAPLADTAWSSLPIALATPVLWWLAGDRSRDPDLPAGTEIVAGPGNGTSDLVVVAGPDRRRRLEAALGGLGAPSALVTPVPADEAEWGAVVRRATLLGTAVVLEVGETLNAASRDHIEHADHLCWAVSSATDLPLGALFKRTWTEVAVAPAAATPAEWALAFPDELASAASSGDSYRLSAEQLFEVRRAALAGGGDLATAVRRLAAGHIETTASRVRPARSWDDLILDANRLAQVREIALRYRHRGTVYEQWGFSPWPSTGVVALFAGPSGTGKTLAAEIVAGDLGVDLYKIDLANLVSKYIGDTEKNLSRVFDAAEASRVVLFFDEADALLGKRSEVSDAHDRYANIEVAYLLQRLESYEGVAVLATNVASNIDSAFLRRIHVVVEFTMPQAEERHRIWLRSIPPGAPTAEGLDLRRLANEIEVTGGTIRNVVTRAAFLAAEQASPITMELILVALQRELEKLGRLVSASEWRRLFSGTESPPRP